MEKRQRSQSTLGEKVPSRTALSVVISTHLPSKRDLPPLSSTSKASGIPRLKISTELNRTTSRQKLSASVTPSAKVNRSVGSITPLPNTEAAELRNLRGKVKELEERVAELEDKCAKEEAEKVSKLKEFSREKVTWRREKGILTEANQKLTKVIEQINRKIDSVKKAHE
eukprot:TRINITY_DN2626_c0_g3_i7.p1 TRINITY_DN2626_c0_g3~~TRINITY_DN2626_c0_g3_i7.p1  ORF type:complete len:169 (-),score=47.55 TRINITY_DN2626_c0_g3_i7:136-642(-)